MVHPSDDTPPGLERFLDAQASVYDEVVSELRLGKKQTHWMWVIFPQLVDLGRSVTAKKYGIANLQEARDYLRHPVLGSRLRACCKLLLTHPALTAEQMLGHIDATKLRSCATLFLHASGGEAVFQSVLDTFYEGVPDPLTQDILSR